MMKEPRELALPLSRCDAGRLELGEIVTVSGRLFTGRSLFHIRGATQGIYPPLDFSKINCFFHVGPVMRRSGEDWEVISAEPTSSIRFERYSPSVIRKLGLRTIIGKTTMGPETAKALEDVGGVHLSKIGLCGNDLVSKIKAVIGVYDVDELGKTEATWVLDVKEFGPFFVDIDAHGHNYFEEIAASTRTSLREVRRTLLGISDEFAWTDVGPSSKPPEGIRRA